VSEESVLLVSCSKSKMEGTIEYPAQELYNSILFRKSRTYAQYHFSSWYILSAQHGLLTPETLVKPYDLTLKNLSVAERKSWSELISLNLSRAYKPGTKFEILAGKAYSFYLVPMLCDLGYQVTQPLKGLGIGQRLAWLNKKVETCVDKTI